MKPSLMITDPRYMIQCGPLTKILLNYSLYDYVFLSKVIFKSWKCHTGKNFREGIPKVHSSALQPIDFQSENPLPF